jgi:hypothetical protein
MPSHLTKLVNRKEMALFPNVGQSLIQIFYPRLGNVKVYDDAFLKQ